MVAAGSFDEATLSLSLSRVRAQITRATARRRVDTGPVKLVAVGKTRPVEALTALRAEGIEDFGENRVQELISKVGHSLEGVKWHFVGTLQKNKVRQVVGLVQLIHSVDNLELAQEIDRRALQAGLIQSVLIQVNVAGEAAKQGVAPENLEKLIAETTKLRHIKVEGLMTMAPRAAEAEEVRPIFAGLFRLYKELGGGREWRWLSMGMTEDFEVAIEEGANMVRIGRALFSPPD